MTTNELHQKALRVAKIYRKADSELVNLLSEMYERRSFYELGYAHIFEYCIEALELSEVQTGYFHRVILKSREVPALKVALQNGELSMSRARRIEPVVTTDNSGEWIHKAKTLTQKELEREVSRANPNAREKKLSTLDKNLKRLGDLLSKGREDLLIQATELLLDKVDPERKADRAVMRAAKATKPPVAKQVGPAVSSGKRVPIPAAVRHQVVLEHGFKCAVCKTSRYVQLHHIKPVHEGGGNEPENLIPLCSGHHRVEHAFNLRHHGSTASRCLRGRQSSGTMYSARPPR